jgi:alpha-1,3-rhamnosyl/mannosyltransferase
MITLIKAFEQVCQHNDQVKLLIAGASGWKFDQTQELLTLSSIRDRIVLLDFISDDAIAGYMRGCVSFVYPSIYEGFGLPVLEALSQEAICIVGDNSCMPEIFGGRALFFETLDVEDLFTTMLSTLTDHSSIKQQLHKGLDEFLARYSWAHHADRFEISLTKLMDE